MDFKCNRAEILVFFFKWASYMTMEIKLQREEWQTWYGTGRMLNIRVALRWAYGKIFVTALAPEQRLQLNSCLASQFLPCPAPAMGLHAQESCFINCGQEWKLWAHFGPGHLCQIGGGVRVTMVPFSGAASFSLRFPAGARTSHGYREGRGLI